MQLKDKFGNRRGSALLIVLGMLSFMVVSAVAFSAFMRQGRLPSSFLRQKILARQLVKAGLAQAMTEIDEAIGDAAYPGQEFGNASNKNYWRNRVYLGYTGNENEGYDYEAGLKETVSTFPLEGLAYIPPPLVNTVRHWSRRSSAAKWKNLDYDSGRWAFTAINVSDYLDINRLKANVMRDSSPSNRISLAFLFEDTSHSDLDGERPKKFDEFIDKAARDANYGRLVSLADYSLAIGSTLYGDVGFKSPFYEFIKNPSGDGAFYGANEETAKMQKFVTDSWYPGTNTVNQLALNDWVNGQPFEGKQQSLDDLQKRGGSRAFREIFCQHLDLAGLASLYDYVDEDNVPISLAVPTLERAPMMTGIRVQPQGFQVELEEEEPYEKPLDQNGAKQVYRTWKIKGLGEGKLIFSGCGVFPFKRSSGLNAPTSYKVQVLAKMFLSDGVIEDTRLPPGFSFKPVVPNDWKNVNGMMASDKAYVTVVGEGTAQIKSKILTPEETTFDIVGVELAFPNNDITGVHVYGTRTDWTYDPQSGTVTPQPPVYDSSRMANPLRYRSGNSVQDVKGKEGLSLRLNVLCWVRMLDNDGNTIDLVPAMTDDDKNYNNHDSGPAAMCDSLCGLAEPVLPTATDALLKLDLATFTGGGAQPSGVGQGGLAIYCDDPRFNYAPEDWYLSANGDVQGSQWLSAAKSRCDGSDHRQMDIFQFVASQGYLQSMGELQFLPYTRDFQSGGSPIDGQFYLSGKYNGRPFAQRTGPDNLANKDYAWKTHYAFGDNADWQKGDDCDPYMWGISDTNGGVTVSPYADEDLFMAALANTPYDYIVAAEKDNESDKDLDKMYELCFNEASQEAKIEWTKLKEIAVQIREKLRSNQEWRKWPEWDDDNFFGQSINNFHDVDRKFLFSYWKPCFANSQQLFLVFVRAEPTVIGGSSAGHTPSQLGARAVALVWREPNSSISETVGNGNTTYHPHCMRVLFYHQFE